MICIMSKLTSLAIGLISAIAILPASEAMAATSNPASASPEPAGNLQAQVIFKIGPQYHDRGYGRRGYYSDWEYDRYRRRLEWAREREARARWRERFYRDRYYRHFDRDYRYHR
jgi:hypothetical protein